jgi:biopolymer transport protein ExbB/TolQ
MNDLQRTIYDVARVLLWPVLVATIICLVWVLIEFGAMLYEVWLRFRFRDLDALQSRALRARKAFADGKPRTAYRYLQENTYSLIVVRFLYDLIRNYQGERLEAKPLKLLQEYEFYSIKRLERTRMLTRLGPMLGLMGTLIPLSPALVGLAQGNFAKLSSNLVTAFSVTVLGLLIGGLSFVVSLVRDRMYSQDISDMEYMLELLQGDDTRLPAGRRRRGDGVWDDQPGVEYEEVVEDELVVAAAEPVVVAGDPAAALAVGDVEAAEAALAAQAAPLESDGATPLESDGATTLEPESATTLAAPPGGDPQETDEPAAPAVEAPPAKAPRDTPTSRQARRKAAASDSPMSFDDPNMSWRTDDDPFAELGPVDVAPRADDEPDS